jgi:peptide/nickel transport system ATP-binding protein
MNTTLQVRNLNVRYRPDDAPPFQAVAGVSFDIAAGETVGLMGESGSGKSTIALSLLGLLPPQTTEVSGSILFQGWDLTWMPELEFQKIRGASISLVSQEPEIALSPVMRVGEQVAEVFRAHHYWPAKKYRIEAEAILDRVGLTETNRIFAAYPHQLSGGQRQRVVLAQALACGPALVIADEPTASLDAVSQSEFIELLRDLKREMQLSLLLISHTPEIQASLADRVLVMKAGRIVEEGSFAQLYRKPSHPYTRSLLRAAGHDGAQESHDWDEPVHAHAHAHGNFSR